MFRAGDKVICIKAYEDNNNIVNKQGTIIKGNDTSGCIYFEYSNDDGYTCHWWVPTPSEYLVVEQKLTRGVNYGDKIRFKFL